MGAQGDRSSLRRGEREGHGVLSAKLDWESAKLVEITDLTPDIRLLTIKREGRFVAPTAGSHINVIVLIDGRPVTRSYSVVGSCRDGLYRIAVKRVADSRGGSRYMWSLARGATLQVSQPANHFDLGFAAAEYVLVAGGIGITPIYGMALTLAAADVPVKLLYAVRTQADLAFVEELRAHLGTRLETFVAEENKRIDLHAVIARMQPDGELYICGPIALLEDAKSLWRSFGRPIERLRFETFGNSGRFATTAFRAEIPRLDLTIEVNANESLLDALERSGVPMIADCRRGECGLCVLQILEVDGRIDHRDVFFSEGQKASNERLCTCVSRIDGGVVTLDVPDRS
jgi:vanillate O-demethylase ferredoxin subunit